MWVLLGGLGTVDDLAVALDRTVALEALVALHDVAHPDGLEAARTLVDALTLMDLVHRLGVVMGQQADLEHTVDQLLRVLGLRDAHPLLVGHLVTGTRPDT